VAIRIPFEVARDFEVPASAAEVFESLADAPLSARHLRRLGGTA
jgi:hypothetical protein